MHKGKTVMIVVGILLVLSAAGVAGGATIFNTHMAYASSTHYSPHANNIGNHAGGDVTSCNAIFC